MLCYEVMLNGRRLCMAGVPDGVLVGALTWTGNHSTEPPESRTNLRVGGISGDNHVDWCLEPLSVGDEVVFRLSDSQTADSPTDLRPIDPVDARRLQRRPRHGPGGVQAVDWGLVCAKSLKKSLIPESLNR
jgi:hypothetical protein